MKALTLKQPWAWAIANAGKRIENRTWPPPQSLIGERIAIHAGKSVDIEGAANIHDATGIVLPMRGLARGAIVATARLASAFYAERLSAVQLVALDDQVKWWCGPWAWCLEDVVRLDPVVPCSGKLGLWSVPEHLLGVVNEREREAA